MIVWYGVSSALLGLILFFPIRKVLLTLSVNRHEQRQGREISGEELQKLKHRLTVWAAVIGMTFAFLYNKFVMLRFFGRFGQP